MNKEDKYYFKQLKKSVERAFTEHNSTTTSIENWKGEEIICFQEDLFNKVKGKVSEKWFYTYIKNSSEKLPRIDVLNLLSNYAGYTNWNTFKVEHKNPSLVKKEKINLLQLLPFLGIVTLIVLYILNKKNTFEFCFIDSLKNENITSVTLDIKILRNNESPINFKTDSLGCFSFKTKSEFIRFVVQSPYHKTDTIVRKIDSNSNQTVKVEPDDYALMLHYYANGKVKDWKNHTGKLESIIADEAKIYRLFKNSMAIEIYSKDEFIRMLTIPTKSLERTEILEKKITNGEISSLKFIVR